MKNILFCFTVLLATSLVTAQTFTLKSKELGGSATMKQVFNGFGCTGENISPQLSWENAPKETKSFAVTIHDESAPTGSGWWHWLIFDIPATTTELLSNAGDVSKNIAPSGTIQSVTDFGKAGYGGPCPPEGNGFHKYTITVYALKTAKLGVDKTANAALVGFNLNGNTIAKASLVFYYKR
jgi:Raf kinase inhibitor-like YbhB/YbcL family protein